MQRELFTRYEGNPILTPDNWPYLIASVFNAGAVNIDGKTVLLVRVEDREGYSHLSLALSDNGLSNWEIKPEPTLRASIEHGEEKFGLEDPRIVWMEEMGQYVITCVCFMASVEKSPPGISLIGTKDFVNFERLSKPLLPQNKDACLFPEKINGHFAMIHRPSIDGRSDIWISFSPDLRFWGDNRVLLPTRHRKWDEHRVGLATSPIKTEKGWLIIYHGARDTVSGALYRLGLALLDLETLEVIRRSKEWVFGPSLKADYEIAGFVDGVTFSCGHVFSSISELYLYYGAADSVVALASADLNELIDYLWNECPEK
jgi:predicted GH43/DUF377 family glycosyl hydrolase